MASAPWPTGLPNSLWDVTLRAQDPVPSLPLMGLRLQDGFPWAFVAGALIVFIVGWRNLRIEEKLATGANYPPIAELRLPDLGGENTLRRACLLYATALTVTYIVLTFFGKLIFELLNYFPQVGVQVNTGAMDFSSPQWPLTLALGFAGVAKMLPPVQIAENWLRFRSYRAVGIPVRIEQTTRKILELLNRQSALATELNTRLSKEDRSSAQLANISSIRLAEILQERSSDNLAETGAQDLLIRALAAEQREFERQVKDGWIAKTLQTRRARWDETLRSYAELHLLLAWAKGGRGAWPGSEVPPSLRTREQKVVADCEQALDAIMLRLDEYTLDRAEKETTSDQSKKPGTTRAEKDEAPTVSPPTGRALFRTLFTRRHSTEEPVVPPPNDPTSADNPTGSADNPTGKDSADYRNQHVRRDKWLNGAVENIRKYRDDLAAILAIYAEKDPDIGHSEAEPPKGGQKLSPSTTLSKQPRGDQLNEPMLRWLLTRAVPAAPGPGPETGVLCCLAAALMLYAVGAWREWHPLPLYSDPMRPDLAVIGATAILETLRLGAIVWVPLLVAFSWRQGLSDSYRWQAGPHSNPDAARRQKVMVTVFGGAAAFACLIGYAILFTFVVARNKERFYEMLFSYELPMLLFFPTQALFAIPLVYFAIKAADRRREGLSPLRCGLRAAAGVLALQIVHIIFWYGTSGAACSYASELPDLVLEKRCWVYYGTFDLIIYPSIAFLSCVIFGEPNPSGPRPVERQAATGTARTAASAGLIVLLAAGLTLPGQVHAQPEKVPEKVEVVVGFRADAEPFSYRAPHDGENDPYRGYLANLCYAILEGNDYDIMATTVTVEDRFDRLKQDRSEGGIDLLCDPTTLRPSLKDGRNSALSSPIVFASSVTYLEHTASASKITEIGYARGSTAENIAPVMCRADRGKMYEKPLSHLVPFACQTALALLRFSETVDGHPDDLPDDMHRCPGRSTPSECLRHAVAEEWRAIQFEIEKRAFGNDTDSMKQHANALKHVLDRLDGLGNPSAAPDQPTGEYIVDYMGGRCGPAPEPYDNEEKTDILDIKYRFCPDDNHNKLISWFCSRTSPPPTTVDGSGIARDIPKSYLYLGDREIILGKHRTWTATHGESSCPIVSATGAETLSYEPYVLLVRKDKPDLFLHVQKRIYELFSDSSKARAYFADAFKGQVMSTALAYLFLLNAVEPETSFDRAVPASPTRQDCPEGTCPAETPATAPASLPQAAHLGDLP